MASTVITTIQITTQGEVFGVVIGTLHQIYEDCIILTGHVLCALAASDGLPVKQTQTSWCVCLS